ncbi:hypothetical protein AHAS_Ahas18G0131000 [Arachis hypogaea]
MFEDLETNQVQAKLQEIEAMGFGFLKLVLRWHVKQSIIILLAKAYNTETGTLPVDHGNIRIEPELFQSVFEILPRGEYNFCVTQYSISMVFPFSTYSTAHFTLFYIHVCCS